MSYKLRELERQETAATGEAAAYHAVCVKLAAKLEELHTVGTFTIVDVQKREMLLERPDATVLLLKDE